MRKFLIKSTMLVAMATVADVMPLTDENRFLVHWGLTHMRDDPSVGVRALLAKSLGDKATQTLNTGTIGFQLAPRINAAGRLQSAKAAVDLLTTLDENLARTLAEQLDQLNEERKTIEKTIVNEAAELVRADPHWKDRAGIVVAHKDWHPGVIGIVATRLIEQFHRPCFVIALKEELGQGSGRSIPGFDLHEALTACGDLLVGYGGHSAAAGLKIQPARVDAFRERFEEHCRKLLTPEHFLPTLSIDAEVPLDSLTMRTVDQIQQLEPFGIGNPKPMLVAHNLLVSKGPTLLGNQGVHMQFEVQDAHQHGLNYRVVAWNQWGKYPDLQQGAVCSLAFQPEINDWRNNRKVQLNLKDVRVGPTTHAQPRPHTASAAAP